ncbi:HNH endonuclease [Aeromonas phage BUCT695]|uniref:HNH endonuclease n=1 Tax=Aeromonas phage BUCT695 TaxID=2908630 RepID=UPI0023291CF1|nr:HNH endonuclease [Aeromonas phage BUCT695]UIW10573.1 HNH endonuclease [Aeromonas phage BUCT695]
MKQIRDTKYYITELGEVYSHRFNPPRKLKGGISTKGYKQYCLYDNNGSQFTIQAHRIVAELYIPNPDNLPQVNHINEDKTDPRADNLEWCSNQYNIDYSQAKQYELIHKDGSVHRAESLNSFARSLGKQNAGNFVKLAKGEIKTCYGFISIKELL